MPVTTVSAAVHITPVVVKTFLKHYKTKGEKYARGDTGEAATDDIFFDEGFNIVKAFIDLGTHNTVESLQAFTNTHVPAPPWAAVATITIPIPTCNTAADILIDWFGPEDLKYVVGGHKWWQVRGLDGIDAEWITEREFLEELDRDKAPERELRWEEEIVLKMEHLETVMLYVHGGAYYWGSINSHRYQMIRYARKFHGRLFAVNYRKAPQYPWPCPLHDVIAAYLYLTRPPPGALHKAVQPEKIVIAGDSAGAGLCVALLTVLRDLDMTQPAGAVLISPWVDLTHSFPSVMSNTSSDIIPPHGFIHEPSVTWPIQSQMSHTVAITETNPPPIPGHADETKPSLERDRVAEALPQEPLPQDEVPSQASMMMLADIIESSDWVDAVNTEIDRASGIQVEPLPGVGASNDGRPHFIEEHEPKPPKVLMENSDDVPLELQSQIQIYATNEQLTHPLVSPLLQASLGNLCPLYILAGDGEVLVDEIVYLAHKAAHPVSYPLREGATRGSKRQQENAKKFTAPTNVHLQVYDGMPHVLTVFGYTDSARYAYRSIAHFVKHVTRHTTYLGNFPFPELYKEVDFEESESDSDSELVKITRTKSKSKPGVLWFHQKSKDKPSEGLEKGNEDLTTSVTRSPVLPYGDNVAVAEEVDTGVGEPDKEEGSSSIPQKEPDVIMLRERVDIRGRIRPMEPAEEIPTLRIPPGQIGLLKEAPVRRWLRGQEMWDEQFKRQSKKVLEKRKKLEENAERIIRNATRQGLVVNTEESEARVPREQTVGGDASEQDEVRPTVEPQGRSKSSRLVLMTGTIDKNLRFGPLDLDDENPPPSAIAKRRDTPEALALLRKCVYHTAPVTHNTVPKRKTMDVIKATLDPSENPAKPPRQSVSEQQVKANIIPMHGLRIWDALIGYTMRKKAKGRAKRAVAAVGHTVSGVVSGGGTTPASQVITKEEQEKRVLLM